MKKLKVLSWIVLICIAMSVSVAAATGISVTLNNVNINVDGKNIAKAGENYNAGGISVPNSILYQGTTYLPIRKIAEAIKGQVDYDPQTKTVNVKRNRDGVLLYNNHTSVPDIGDIIGKPVVHQSENGTTFTRTYDISDLTSTIYWDIGKVFARCEYRFLGTEVSDNGYLIYKFDKTEYNSNYVFAMYGTYIDSQTGKVMLLLSVADS